jgi:DNA-binding response OmpR family regulator
MPIFRPMHILVADDEAPVAQLLASVCARGPHRISLETSGAGVLDFLAATPIDLLVADAEMSDLSSSALLAAVRSIQPGLPVLATITRDEPLLVADLLGEGAADVLRKPFTMDEFAIRLALVEERMRYARDFAAETAARRHWRAVAEFTPRTGVKDRPASLLRFEHMRRWPGAA